MKLSQAARFRPQHVMVFGEPKTGKTTLVTKLLTKGYNLTWISMDNGHEPLWKVGLPSEELDKRVNLIVLPDTKEFPVAYSTCLRIISGKACKICDLHGQVDCQNCLRDEKVPALQGLVTWSYVDVSTLGPKDIIVFDHLEQLSSSVMNAIFRKEKKAEDDKAEWDDYYRQGSVMSKFLMNVQQATYNIVCITQVCETELEDKSKKLTPLIGTTNFSRNAGKYFDHIIYCEVVNGDHKFGSGTGYRNRVITGSRRDIKIEKLGEPSLEQFFDGTIEPPALAGASAAKKLLNPTVVIPPSKEEELSVLTTKPDPAITDIRNPYGIGVKKEPVPTLEDEVVTAEESMDKEWAEALARASQKNSPPPPPVPQTSVPTPTPSGTEPGSERRLALLAALKKNR